MAIPAATITGIAVTRPITAMGDLMAGGAAVGAGAAAGDGVADSAADSATATDFVAVFTDSMVVGSMVVDPTVVDSTEATVKPGPRRPEWRFCSGPGDHPPGPGFFQTG